MSQPEAIEIAPPKYGLDLPPFDELADAALLAELAAEAESAGWDGVFLWDHLQYREPNEAAVDPWIALTAIAVATETVRLGPMVTPIARRRPAVLARQTTTLDRLSNGRLIFGAGLGLDQSGRELSAFGEELNDRTRAAMLDEGLGLLDALWTGETVNHRGEHYLADNVRFLPPPVQRPRPPVWLAARWPNRHPLRRAARWDGLFPLVDTPEMLAEMLATIAEFRSASDPFAVAVLLNTDQDQAAWCEAGATWILTDIDRTALSANAVRDLIADFRSLGGPIESNET